MPAAWKDPGTGGQGHGATDHAVSNSAGARPKPQHDPTLRGDRTKHGGQQGAQGGKVRNRHRVRGPQGSQGRTGPPAGGERTITAP
jgi:hypothetical protein